MSREAKTQTDIDRRFENRNGKAGDLKENESGRDTSSFSRAGCLKIGRVFGVDVKLHWSLLFLALYVVFLAGVEFPYVVRESGLNAGMIHWVPGVFGVVFAIGLFLSVVTHELGHVLVARTQGVEVRGIVLMMLGGVSEMGKVPEKAYSELKLAIVGPLVSLSLSGLFWGIYLAFASRSPTLSLLGYWLANVNLMLAVFNLIPALPLDGGRVLRSYLAVKQGMMKATENSVKVSQIFAWALGALGFLQFNFFLMLIAFFIYTAAQIELTNLVTRATLDGIRVREAMSPVESVPENTSVHDAALKMLHTRSQFLPIQLNFGENYLVSLNSVRNVEKGRWRITEVKDIMEPVAFTLDIDDFVNHAISIMTDHAVQAALVVDHDKVVGVLKSSDLADLIQFKSIEKSSMYTKEDPKKVA